MSWIKFQFWVESGVSKIKNLLGYFEQNFCTKQHVGFFFTSRTWGEGFSQQTRMLLRLQGAAPLQNNKCVLEKNIFDDANILLVISYMK